MNDVSSISQEQKTHKGRQGFTRYAGPKLRGERTVLERGKAGFPEALVSIPDPPKKLYVLGDPSALREGMAIVGARKATPYGIACAQRFARQAAIRGIPVISGGARGCDELYPASHFGLFQEIVDAGGAIVSEQAWNFPPMKFAFRARNRLIAGLAKATLITEAGLPSGTFSTADEALAANREVLVVPGSITSFASRGANRLLSQGAIPIVDDESFQMVIDTLFPWEGELPVGRLGAEDAATCDQRDGVLAALRASPMNIDEMLRAGFVDPSGKEKQEIDARRSSDSLTRLMVRLAELERSGAIMRYPDGRYGARVV